MSGRPASLPSAGRARTYPVVLGIAAINALAIFVLSILAVQGDGSSDGIMTVQRIGFSALAVTTVLALVLGALGKHAAAVATVAATLPALVAGAVLFPVAKSTVEHSTPPPPAFVAACQEMGARYLKAPSQPVRSIVYDWPKDARPPGINYFQVSDNGRISAYRSGFGGRPPAQIEFIENRCCRHEGRPTTGAGLPYVRHPNSDAPYFGIAEPSADALVMFRSLTADLQRVNPNLSGQEVQVIDRRTGDTLATLRYMVDAAEQRACGTTGNGVMDERAFVLKAVGVQ